MFGMSPCLPDCTPKGYPWHFSKSAACGHSNFSLFTILCSLFPQLFLFCFAKQFPVHSLSHPPPIT
jgi:hypothetical protein